MECKRVAVIGAGIMGSGIAQTFARAGIEVALRDVEKAALDRAVDRIENGRFGLQRGVALGKVQSADVAPTLARIKTTTAIAAACEGADLVLEAVYEDLGLKIRVFEELDALASAGAILASNTSGFSIGALAAATDRPGLVIGWHWASPPPLMPLAEIVVHKGTDNKTRDAVVTLARRIGKNPVVIKDQPMAWGFVANRVFMAAAREAADIVREGVATEDDVDTLMKDCFRWPVGPFEASGMAVRGWDRDVEPQMDLSQHAFDLKS
ncbi:MAG: 3-hydroxyacyl-CoA dehydrogenase family protein [Candidatus Dormibacteria bacterium]